MNTIESVNNQDEIDLENKGIQEAEVVETEIFETKENAVNTAEVIRSFVASYEENKNTTPLNEWLKSEFAKYPAVWQDQKELSDTADEVIDSVTRLNKSKEELYAHLDSGKSKESFLVRKIEEGAKAAGVVNVGEYAAQIDKALQSSNDAMWSTVTRGDGLISQQLHLDGFIAEQHHANSFNIDAVTKGSTLRAEVLIPNGSSYNANGVDIVIKDSTTGKTIRRYQAKYGYDADATQKYFDKGDYRGQRKLVPEGQSRHIKNSIEVIELSGVRSKPLSKQNAKLMQQQYQQDQIRREQNIYNWNDINKIDISKKIAKQASIAALMAVAFQGGRILGRRAWNGLTGKNNQSIGEDLREWFKTSIKSAAGVAIQVIVSAALIVAARNGWIKILQEVPVETIAFIAYIGIEYCKIIYKMANGELSMIEGLDAMANVTCSVIGGNYGAFYGGIIGGACTPFCPAIGAVLGSVVGGIIGSCLGEYGYQLSKNIISTALKSLYEIYEYTEEKIAEATEELNRIFNLNFA